MANWLEWVNDWMVVWLDGWTTKGLDDWLAKRLDGLPAGVAGWLYDWMRGLAELRLVGIAV